MSHYLTGSELTAAIAQSPPPAAPLITDFLYTDSVCLLTGAAGKGKTVLAIQIAASLSSATALFGSLDVPQPRSVYYLQLEGSERETLMRLHFLSQSVPVDGTYFHFDFDKRFRATWPELVKQKLVLIKERVSGSLDLFIADPIYKLAGDLAKAENALAVITLSDLLTEMFHCSVLLIHHPHRERYDAKGEVIQETNPYYGHSFLFNHVDSSYLMTNPGPDLVELRRDKVREENARARLQLLYHPESYSLSMEPDVPSKTKTERVDRFLASCRAEGRPTTFAEIKAHCVVSATFLRDLQADYLRHHQVKFHKVPGKATLWLPC